MMKIEGLVVSHLSMEGLVITHIKLEGEAHVDGS